MNRIILIGRNVKEIELKQTASGVSVSEFTIAVNRSFKNANGERESDFFNCIAFSKLAETISRYVKKGDQVGVEGRLQTRNYTNKDGKKVYVTEIIVENVEFLQSKKEQNQPIGEDTLANAKWEELKTDDDLPF